MAVPLTLAILVLGALVGVLTWLLVRSERRNAELMAQLVQQSTAYADQSLKVAAGMTRNGANQADKMLTVVARSVTEVTAAVRGAMTDSLAAMYGPAQAQAQVMADSLADLPTPWYANEGSADYSDPTDAFLGGIADPIADNHQNAGGNLLLQDGPAGFGLPEGAFD